jgi:peroxiredoxin
MKLTTKKIQAGATFPEIRVKALDGATVDVGRIIGDATWKMVVVYRGVHCPLCTRFLNGLETWVERLGAAGVEVAAVSADSREQLGRHLEKLDVSFPLYHGLTTEQMQALGVYVSVPRSPQETDHNFAEPGLFVVNEDHRVQVVDVSNNPFVRPEPEALVSGIEWIRDPENNYPIRGTWAA